MPLYPPPARADISNTPSPSNATANAGFGAVWDFMTSLLGLTGDPADARDALGFPATPTAGTVMVGDGTDYLSTPYDNDPVNDNGTFEVNQRGATSVADDTYFVDRYYILTESGNVTVAQTTDPEDGAPWGIRLTQPDASAKRMGVATICESKNCRKLRNAVATLAARVKLSTGGTLRYAIIEHTGTADVVTSDVVNNWASTTFTASNFFIAGLNILQCGTITPGAATWGNLAGYGTVGGTMNNLICFVWTEAAAAQNVTLDINRFRCVPGAVALPQRFRRNEFEICLRYCPVWSANSGQSLGITGTCYLASAAELTAPYQVKPRVKPTGITPTAGNVFALLKADGTLSAVSTPSVNGSASSTSGLSILLTGTSGLGLGNSTILYASGGSAKIIAEGCEL